MSIFFILAAKLDIGVSSTNILPDSNYIYLTLGQITNKHNVPISSPEAYHIVTMASTNIITIKGGDLPGLRYGVQTVISLQDGKGTLPELDIIDYPRFSYRGV